MENMATAAVECSLCGWRPVADVGSNFCGSCWTSGVLVPIGWRKADEYKRQGPRVRSAFDLAAEGRCKGELKPYQIRMPKVGLVLIHGLPGSGKSSMALRIAAANVPAAYFSLEQRHGPALGDQLRRLEIRSRELSVYTPPLAVNDVFETAARVVVIDSVSVSTFTPADLRSMADEKLVIGILQSTKDGGFRGSQTWLHEADVCIAVDSMTWRVSKSRFNEAGESGEV